MAYVVMIARSNCTIDFDGDGKVGFPDFLQFAGAFGLGRGDAGFDVRYAMAGDAAIGSTSSLCTDTLARKFTPSWRNKVTGSG